MADNKKPSLVKWSDIPKWKKYVGYVVIASISYMVLFRPERTGIIIGSWIHAFVGSLWKSMQF